MVDVITCAIFGDSRLRGVGVVRGVSLPSPIDLTRRPYNTGHVWCPRRICAQLTRDLLVIAKFLFHISWQVNEIGWWNFYTADCASDYKMDDN